MILTILICLSATCTPETAHDIIQRPATQLECAMPWMALPEQADPRNAGMYIVARCERNTQ